jgi:hypothetical protein
MEKADASIMSDHQQTPAKPNTIPVTTSAFSSGNPTGNQMDFLLRLNVHTGHQTICV